MTDYRGVSLWLDQHPGPLDPRPQLPGDTDADVAIVGAGFTGLWTAYYLHRADPSLRIVVLEREIAGFGASGRNGGWCSALFPTSWSRIAREHGRPAALAMRRAMQDSVSQVLSAAQREGIDCGSAHGGTVTFARNLAQLDRARREVEESRAWGGSDEDLRLLDADEAGSVAGVTAPLGALYTPHCAAVNPAALVRGLADRVEAGGVCLYEHTAVEDIRPHRVLTSHGTVRAEVVVRATEAFTVDLPGHRRDLLPIYSLIVATEPLTPDRLAAVGLTDRPTFGDLGHVTCYGQRSADSRIVFGGRGAPYHFGSSIGPANDRNDRVFSRLRHAVSELFPALRGVAFTHSWGGAVAAPRDWHAGVGLDRGTGLAWAGGYVGDGVATTNLAGRTLADLIVGADTDLARLPWVGHRSRRWEVEPLRFLGVNAGIAVMSAADRAEARTGRPSRAAVVAGRLMGG